MGFISSLENSLDLFKEKDGVTGDVLLVNLVVNYILFGVYFISIILLTIFLMIAFYSSMLFAFQIPDQTLLIILFSGMGIYFTIIFVILFGVGIYQKINDISSISSTLNPKKMSFKEGMAHFWISKGDHGKDGLKLALLNIIFYTVISLSFTALMILPFIILIAEEYYLISMIYYCLLFLIIMAMTPAIYAYTIFTVDITCFNMVYKRMGVLNSFSWALNMPLNRTRGFTYYLLVFYLLTLASSIFSNLTIPLVFTFSKLYILSNPDLFGFGMKRGGNAYSFNMEEVMRRYRQVTPEHTPLEKGVP